MNQLKLDKKYVMAGLVILLVILFVFMSSGDNEIIKPNTNSTNSNVTSSMNGNSEKSDPSELKVYDYTEAMDHIGEYAKIRGEVLRVFTAKSGVTFLDFCEDFNDCSFSAVIFASDAKKFEDLSKYQSNELVITGQVKSYNGKAEIIIKNPEQIEII